MKTRSNSEKVKSVTLKIPYEIIWAEDLRIRQLNKPDSIHEWHRVEFNVLLIVTEGEGYHHIDFKKYYLKAGDIIPIKKGRVHHFHEEKTIFAISIGFTEELLVKNFSNHFHQAYGRVFHLPKISLNQEELKRLKNYINISFSEYNKKRNENREELLASNLASILLLIDRYSPLDHKNSNTKRFKDFIAFKNLLNSKFRESHNARFYAEQLNFSYKYLNEISKEMAQKTAKAYIDSYLITEIKRDIAQYCYSMKEVSFRTGFDEPTNFVRFFKKHTGMTPNNFSKKLKKE